MAERIEVLKSADRDQLAVVALGVDFPACRGIDGYFQAVYHGLNLAKASPDWQPTGSLERAVHQVLSVCRSQSIETGLVVVGPAAEAAVVKRLVDGPSLDYAGYAEPLPAMLIQAHEWLEAHEVRAVILAGCSLSGQSGESDATFGFDQAVHSSQPGSGSVALLVMHQAEAIRRKIPILAVLDALAYQKPAALNAAGIKACAQAAMQAAGVFPRQIGVLAALAAGNDLLDQAEIKGLTEAYQAPGTFTALSSAQANNGWLEGVNGLANLVRAVVCLEHTLRPGVPNWSGPKEPGLWTGSSFYVLSDALTWFKPHRPDVRRAGISLLSSDGSCGHILLSQIENTKPTAKVAVLEAGMTLLPVHGDSANEIITNLQTLKTQLENGENLESLGKRLYFQGAESRTATTAVILAHTLQEALREIDFAMRGIPGAVEKGTEWLTPSGSCYNPAPIGTAGKVAFVYPGAFNSYLGVGQGLFTLFPDLQERFAATAEDISAVLCEEQLYPRSLAPLAKDQRELLETALLDDAFAMMASGLSISVALTIVFRDIFKLSPDSAFGYSLGENSMLFALGVWRDGEALGERLKTSPLFRNRLAGPQNAVREYWRLPPVVSSEAWGELWGNYLLMAPVERVEQAIAGEPQVYMTHINTPRQVVIAGDPNACRRVIENLKCSSLRAPFNYVLHCKAMESEYQALYDLHTWPLHETLPIKMYSAADDRPFELSESGVARAVAHDLCTRLDFPRLIDTVYQDGARIFIELGAGSNCSKWIEDTLRGRPFLSVSANRKGVDDATAIYRVLARLVSHQAALDLAPLFANR